MATTPRYRVYFSPGHIWISSSATKDYLRIATESGESMICCTKAPSAVFICSSVIIVGLTPDKASLVLGTQSSLICSGSPIIQRLESFLILDLRQVPKETAEMKQKLLSSTLKTPYFYFSLEADLTRPGLPPITSETFFSKADKRYVWNASHLDRLCYDRGHFKVPLIHGAVFTFRTPIINKNKKSHLLQWMLISRRSNQHVGTRFFSRGIDLSGNVSNHVETEQILRLEGVFESSFLQTRGSIPLFWHQTPDIRYMPQPWTHPSGNSARAARLHFKEGLELYGGSLTCVNLVNQKKGEGRMERAFAHVVNEVGLDEVHYVPFDFHAECKKSKGGWAQLYKLIRLLKKDFDNYGYSLKYGRVSEEQKGVFRTNCMDCLDRTNVVQSLLATEHINSVLKRTSVLTEEDSILNYPTFQNLYKNAWADHANLISIQYSGTGALKTDFTRTGVRTKWGLLQDGWNSAYRYVFNNFHDGFRTDALNYFLGRIPIDFILSKDGGRDTSKDSLLKSFPSILKGFISLFVLMLVFLTPEDNMPLVSLMTLILTLLLWIFKMNGPHFVNYPTDYDIRACPPLQPGTGKKNGL